MKCAEELIIGNMINLDLEPTIAEVLNTLSKFEYLAELPHAELITLASELKSAAVAASGSAHGRVMGKGKGARRGQRKHLIPFYLNQVRHALNAAGITITNTKNKYSPKRKGSGSPLYYRVAHAIARHTNVVLPNGHAGPLALPIGLMPQDKVATTLAVVEAYEVDYFTDESGTKATRYVATK